MISVAILGYKGFLGSAINKVFSKDKKINLLRIDRKKFENIEDNSIKCNFVINCSMPSKRFWAENNPELDFIETVKKTKRIISKFPFSKLIHISSISARTQTHLIYGKNKKKAEDLINLKKNLVFRLGPLYGDNLSKGVIIDILKGNKVFVSKDSKYAFTHIDWVAQIIKNNLNMKGLVEVGANGFIEVGNLARILNSNSSFEGERDDQTFKKIFSDTPDAIEVIEYAKNLKI
tara:strand:- start:8760 stop:9458 length:699 start_codon:yes stop_codon:yes gene_type:complete